MGAIIVLIEITGNLSVRPHGEGRLAWDGPETGPGSYVCETGPGSLEARYVAPGGLTRCKTRHVTSSRTGLLADAPGGRFRYNGGGVLCI